MKDLEQLLAEHPLFAQLDHDTRSLLAGCATNRHLRDQECLFRTGDAAEHCYLVRRGRIAL